MSGSCHDNTQIMNMKGATSVKYSGQKPGGNSSIQLGGGYGDDDDRFGGKGVNKKPTQKEEEEEKQEETLEQAQQAAQEVPAAGKQAFTSVKYSGQPPGGRSNFTLG